MMLLLKSLYLRVDFLELQLSGCYERKQSMLFGIEGSKLGFDATACLV